MTADDHRARLGLGRHRGSDRLPAGHRPAGDAPAARVLAVGRADRRLGRRRDRVRDRHRRHSRRRRRPAVFRRVPHRAGAERGQPVRLRAALPGLGGARRLPAPRAARRGDRRARAAGRVHRRRGRAARPAELGVLRLRRAAAGRRAADGPRRHRHRAVRRPGAARPAPGRPGQCRLRRDALRHPAGGEAGRHPSAGRPGGRGYNRPHLRGGLHPGVVRDHDERVHRLHGQRVRGPRAAVPVLRAGRRAAPVQLSAPGYDGAARLYRGEDDSRTGAAHPHRGEPGRHRRDHRGCGGGQPVAELAPGPPRGPGSPPGRAGRPPGPARRPPGRDRRAAARAGARRSPA